MASFLSARKAEMGKVGCNLPAAVITSVDDPEVHDNYFSAQTIAKSSSRTFIVVSFFSHVYVCFQVNAQNNFVYILFAGFSGINSGVFIPARCVMTLFSLLFLLN